MIFAGAPRPLKLAYGTAGLLARGSSPPACLPSSRMPDSSGVLANGSPPTVAGAAAALTPLQDRTAFSLSPSHCRKRTVSSHLSPVGHACQCVAKAIAVGPNSSIVPQPMVPERVSRECGATRLIVNAAAAPATVSGKSLPERPSGRDATGEIREGGKRRLIREPGDLPKAGET
jgi:hypothetical protein